MVYNLKAACCWPWLAAEKSLGRANPATGHGGWQAPGKVWGEQPGMGRPAPAWQGSPSPGPQCSPGFLARCLGGAVLMGTDGRRTL